MPNRNTAKPFPKILQVTVCSQGPCAAIKQKYPVFVPSSTIFVQDLLEPVVSVVKYPRDSLNPKKIL